MTRKHRSAAPSLKERSVTAISLLLLVGLFSAAGAIMAYHFLKNPDILFAGKSLEKPVATPVRLAFQDGKFKIPGYLIHKIKRSRLRKIAKVRLMVPLDWQPFQAPVAFTSKSDLSEWLLASIESRTSAVSTADKLAKIFRHYIAAPAAIHSSGLFRYRFEPGSPYDSIELFTDDLQSPGFIIRCEMQTPIGGTRLCHRQMKISSRLTLSYKFPRSQINQWQQVHNTMQKLLDAIYKPRGV